MQKLETPLKWNEAEQSYWYLNRVDSAIYRQVIKEEADRKDEIIRRLLEEKAQDSWAAHCRSTY